MDSSRSIGSSNYQKQKTFVSKLLSAFDISNSKTRIGVVTYSNDVKVDIPLGSIATLPELQKAVDNLPYHARGTNTGDAIHFVRKVGFVKGVSRPEVAHIMIVLTDGLSMDSEKTRKESSLAHDAGIYVFAIGIGKGVDTVELSAIASNPDKNFLFHVENFDALSSIRTLLATRTCEVLPKDEAAPSSGKNLKANYFNACHLISISNPRDNCQIISIVTNDFFFHFSCTPTEIWTNGHRFCLRCIRHWSSEDPYHQQIHLVHRKKDHYWDGRHLGWSSDSGLSGNDAQWSGSGNILE